MRTASIGYGFLTLQVSFGAVRCGVYTMLPTLLRWAATLPSMSLYAVVGLGSTPYVANTPYTDLRCVWSKHFITSTAPHSTLVAHKGVPHLYCGAVPRVSDSLALYACMENFVKPCVCYPIANGFEPRCCTHAIDRVGSHACSLCERILEHVWVFGLSKEGCLSMQEIIGPFPVCI